MTAFTGAIHPAALIFPELDDAELDSLALSIQMEGLHEPITLLPDGTLLDGRNRLRACQIAGVDPVFRVYDGNDPVGYAIAVNIHRRHLTVGQRALLATEVLPLFEAQARQAMARGGASAAPGRPREKGLADLPDLPEARSSLDSRGSAATATGASPRAVGQAKRVKDKAPDLADKVRTGELALDRAERIVRDREAAARRIEQARQQQQQIQVGTRVDIRHGDFREVLSDLTDIDAIITDPPYPGEFLHLLPDLAAWADKVLAPDGVLVILFGQTYLPEVYRLLDGGRPYRWTGCYLTPGAGYASMARRVQSNWKPVLVYGGGSRFSDVIRSEGIDVAAKSLHHWGQDYGAFHQLVERLTEPGQTVVDPFMGSGTTLLAAQALGRHAVGCDTEASHVETARRRIA